MRTLWMYEEYVSTRECFRFFLPAAEVAFTAFAVFLEGAAFAILVDGWREER